MKNIILKNGKNLNIRKLEANDENVMQNFFLQIGNETTFTNNYPNQPLKNATKLVAAWQNERDLYLGAFDNQIPVGLILLNISKPEHPWLHHIGSFGVMILKDYQGQGLGKILMQEMLDFANTQHLHRIEGEVRAPNVQALSLYEKFGFAVEGKKMHAALINGEWIDNYLIAKLI